MMMGLRQVSVGASGPMVREDGGEAARVLSRLVLVRGSSGGVSRGKPSLGKLEELVEELVRQSITEEKESIGKLGLLLFLGKPTAGQKNRHGHFGRSQ